MSEPVREAASNDCWPKMVGFIRSPHVQLLDLAKTQMQETGACAMSYLTLAEAVEIVTDLGIDPRKVALSCGHLAQVKLVVK